MGLAKNQFRYQNGLYEFEIFTLNLKSFEKLFLA
jgi:hypothetical protein